MMMGKVDTSITFVGGSNHTVVTENYARRMRPEEEREWLPKDWIWQPRGDNG